MQIGQFERLVKACSKDGNKPPLRNAVRLMRHADLDPAAFVAGGENGIVEVIGSFVRHGGDDRPVPAALGQPTRAARAILYALARLCAEFPAVGLPVCEAPVDKFLRILPPEREPRRLREQLASWTPYIVGSDGHSGCGGAIKKSVKDEYICKARALWALCHKQLNLPLAGEVGLEQLTEPDMIDLWLPEILKHYSATGVAPFLSGIKRIVTDLLGADHPNAQALKAAVAAHFTRQEIDADKLQHLRRLAAPSGAPLAATATIWDAPRLMMKAVGAPGLKPSDRTARASSAVAVALLISSPGLQPAALAALNLRTDIRGHGRERQLGRTERGGTLVLEPVMPEACDLLDELQSLRKRLKRMSELLFPNRSNTAPQTRQIAMEQICRNLTAVLGVNATTATVRDVAGLVAIETNPKNVKEISEALGQKAVRSSERRYRLLLDRPAAGTAGRSP